MSIRMRLAARLVVVAAVLAAAWQLISWTQPVAAFGVLERFTPNLVWRVKTERPLVALSFDDGPDPEFTPQVLAILAKHGAKATFFVIGERAARHPELVLRIKADGHEVGNHYFMNGATLSHSDADFIGYLDRTEWAAGITGPVKLFRPPGGVAWSRQLQLARARGYTSVLGSAYPHDPAHPPVWYIRWLVKKNLAAGAIVILHDGIPDPRRSIEALPDILIAGRQKGLQFVSIGVLLESGSTPPNKQMQRTSAARAMDRRSRHEQTRRPRSGYSPRCGLALGAAVETLSRATSSMSPREHRSAGGGHSAPGVRRISR